MVAGPYTLPIGEAQPHGPHRRAVGSVGASYPGSTSKGRWTSTSPGGLAISAGCRRPHSRTRSHLSDDPGGDFSIGVATAMCPRLYRLVCEALRTSENRPYSINYTSSVAGPSNARLWDGSFPSRIPVP